MALDLAELSVERGHERGVPGDVSVHGFHYVGAGGVCRQIELFIQREQFERVVVRDGDVLRRAWRAVAEDAALAGAAVLVPQAGA